MIRTSQKYETVSMIRENLDDIPTFELPLSFSIRWYELGDDRSWINIQKHADRYNTITSELFDREFNNDAESLARRQCFLIDTNGTAVGTATAWFGGKYHGRPYGRLHWVAIVPRVQGQGLAKPLLTTVCQRLRDLGHQRAYLSTSPERIPAINLYLGFGFAPEIKNTHDSEIWTDIQKRVAKRIRLVNRPTTCP
jgi:GNAT superfamily N-acetyltransferase